MLPASAPGRDLDGDAALLLALVLERLERRVDDVQRRADERERGDGDEAPEPAPRLGRAGREHRAAGLADPLRARGAAHRRALGDGGPPRRAQRLQLIRLVVLGLGIARRRHVGLAAPARGAPGRPLLGGTPALVWCPSPHLYGSLALLGSQE